MHKRYFPFFFLLLVLIVIVPATATAELPLQANQPLSREIVLTPGSPQVIITGTETTIEAVPYIDNGITMIPLRFLSQELLQAVVQWDGATRTVMINDGRRTILLDLSRNTATIDENVFHLSPPPVLRDGYTFVPLRFLAEAAGLQVTYNLENRTITIFSAPVVVLLPFADFILPQGLIAGQILTYEDRSRDPLGRAIVDHVWTISKDGRQVITNNLASALSKPTSGEYLISLQVKNAMGIWSDLTTKTLTVATNLPPRLVNFSSKKSEVALGEKIDFHYVVENEAWEQIVGERWAYAWFDGNQQQLKREKPRAFFLPGAYEIMLQVRDEYGNWSEEANTIITVTETMLKTEADFKFSNPVPGELFLNHLNINFNMLADAAARIIHGEDVTLIASNNPEKVRETGILYQDQAYGMVRIRYHHQNETQNNMNIYAIAENITEAPVELILLRRGMAGPSTDVMHVGQQVVIAYLGSNHYQKLTLQPGAKVILNREQKTTKPQELIAGLLDIHTGDRLLFTIVASPEREVMEDYQNMPYLNKEGSHVRGTFAGANQSIYVEIEGAEKEKVVIGRYDAFPDYFLQGVDGITGEALTNRGNRGVVYTISLKAEQTVGVLFNPRGTIYKGAMLGFEQNIWILPNAGTLHGSREGVVLGTIKKGETRTITYVPPSGSDTPFLLVFIPEAEW